MREWKNISHANGKQKKAGVAILIPDEIDLKIKKIIRDKEGHYSYQGISPRGRHNNCKYLCTQHRNTSIHKTNTILRDFNTLLTPMDRSSQQKINKETQVLNDTLDEMDLIDIFRTFHPNAI